MVGPADWPTYQHDTARSGVAPQLSSVGSSLGVGWRAELDGAVYGQPLVIGDQAIAATEDDRVRPCPRGTRQRVLPGGDVVRMVNCPNPSQSFR